jgi:hypothetical protein
MADHARQVESKKKASEVVQWNRRLKENMIEYNEPFTGLEITDY